MTLHFANHPLRYRYEDKSGRAVWLAFDPAFPCLYCNASVDELSAGGPAICPSCDSGSFPGDPYDWANISLRTMAANQRLLELPHDPAWQEYEAVYQNSAWLKQHCSCVGGGFSDTGSPPPDGKSRS